MLSARLVPSLSARILASAIGALPPRWRFQLRYTQLRSPKVLGRANLDPAREPAVMAALAKLGVSVEDRAIDTRAYRAFVAAADYGGRYSGYYAGNLAEKSLEHFVALDLLRLDRSDVYIDVASEESPVPEIYHRLTGCETYAQDLAYPGGLHGRRIGGDAARMPVPEGFATKMALHCSFEHFEGDSDRGFVTECARVLRPGGRVVIVPLYLTERYAIQTDPAVSVPAKVTFEPDATLHAAYRWGNRHGRFYDPAHLVDRLVTPNRTGLRISAIRFTNLSEVDPTCYARFALVIDRLPSGTGQLAGTPT